MKASTKGALRALAGGLIFVACEGWHDWDNVFDRDSKNENAPEGWRVGDGDAVIDMPCGTGGAYNCRGRAYGDSFVYKPPSIAATEDLPTINSIQYAYTSPKMPRNTFAFHYNTSSSQPWTPPTSSQIIFCGPHGIKA